MGKSYYQKRLTCRHHPDRPAIKIGLCAECHQRRPERFKESGRRAQQKRYRTVHGRAYSMWLSARNSGHECTLEPSDVVIPSHCPVFGVQLVLDADRRQAPDVPSLDRIDNSKGYVKGNVWVISWRANMLKRDSSLDELKRLVAAIEEQGRREFRRISHARLTRGH